MPVVDLWRRPHPASQWFCGVIRKAGAACVRLKRTVRIHFPVGRFSMLWKYVGLRCERAFSCRRGYWPI